MDKPRLICPKCGTADRLGFFQTQMVLYSLVDVDDDWPELDDVVDEAWRVESTGPAACLECGEQFPLADVIREEVDSISGKTRRQLHAEAKASPKLQTYYWETNLFDPEAGKLDVFVYMDKEDEWDSRTLLAEADDWNTCLKDIEVPRGSGRTIGQVPGLFDRLTDALAERWSAIVKRNACVKGEIVMEVSNG